MRRLEALLYLAAQNSFKYLRKKKIARAVDILPEAYPMIPL
jgi:hypothetical protein